ncbi:hypothetical protein [Aureimonas psammosilenae]|uniref:hypothetical protein n=1 Tax=Aureimonas psammosilenae TaxID=2495496 RepID=UPI001260E57A|nr:hypothetical protein [Aureimonas psammosilenae]
MDDEIEVDEVTELEDPLAGLRTDEQRDRARRMRPGFSHAIAACGLSTEEAMAYLGQSRSAIEKKRAGVLAMTPDDAKALSALWHRIRTGRVEGLDPGPFGMAVTMLVLSGKHIPKRVPRGRPRYVPLEAPADAPS